VKVLTTISLLIALKLSKWENDPVKSFLEKTDSGLVKGFVYLSKGIIDGFASAGNTGAMLVGAQK
jgi:glycerol-3-phosphate acyltransferase PlsX